MARIAKKTRKHVLKILKVLREAYEEGEILSVNRIANQTGIHKWSVSRILDLYMPYVSVKTIPELEAIGMSTKLIELEQPKVTDKQALAILDARG